MAVDRREASRIVHFHRREEDKLLLIRYLWFGLIFAGIGYLGVGVSELKIDQKILLERVHSIELHLAANDN